MRLSSGTIPTTDCANSSDLLNLAFGYGASNNNGSVLSQTIVMPKQTGGALTLTQNDGYDGVNRLQSAGETVAGDDDGVSAGQRQFREAAGRDVRSQAGPETVAAAAG